ncbi:hypothetical protein V6Z11_A06G155400 [Gossypium hirsutum]
MTLLPLYNSCYTDIGLLFKSLVGRINGSLNLARAIGDAEFKQNKTLPAEKQIVTANPEINAEHTYCTLIAENFATALPQILVVQGFSLLLIKKNEIRC